ncbi:MAG: hypothetical protein J7L21_02890 [Sulfurimonas sp.]|nr:hypothetical protein [Sulfurimonas sp.]
MSVGLFRKSVKLTFEEKEITIKEISVEVLLKVESGEITLDNAFLLNECAGLDIEKISPIAYKPIMEKIDSLHKDYFETEESEDETVKKK